ncbi:MAG: flagellar motor protein MotB, partial [Nitrospinota bacterium]
MARKSKKQSGDGGNSSSFIVLFTALSTILLALFIMMNAQATREEYKVREVWGAVQSNFGVLEGGLRITPGETFYPPGPPVVMAGVEDWTESVLLTDMVGF